MLSNPDRLRKIPLFTDLSNSSCRRIAQFAAQRTIRAGEMILHEGFPAEYCYFILKGELRALRINQEGRVQVLARLSRSDPVNLVSLLHSDGKNLASIEALTNCDLISLSGSGLQTLLGECPDFSQALLTALADRVAGMVDLAAGLSLNTVRTRLARFLIKLTESPQTTGGWTQDEIAAQIGTVRDVVGRLLREFEDHQLIQRQKHLIRLLDRKALFKEAKLPQKNN
jgi:CRP-like cAMP-binding protein